MCLMAVPVRVAHGWEEGTWREGHRQARKPTPCGHVVYSETLKTVAFASGHVFQGVSELERTFEIISLCLWRKEVNDYKGHTVR